MFGIIEVAQVSGNGLLFALTEKFRRKGGIRTEEELLMGAHVLRVRIPRYKRDGRAAMARRAKKAAGIIRERGVRKAVFPVGFPYLREFMQEGVEPFPVYSLYRAAAPEIALEAMRECGIDPERATVAVTGSRVTGQMRKTVIELAGTVRYIALDAMTGGEALSRTLRREYGVPVTSGPTEHQLAGAQVLLLFEIPEDIPLGQTAVIPLCENDLKGENVVSGVFFLLPPELEGKVPGGCDLSQLLAALTETGFAGEGRFGISGLVWNYTQEDT